MDIGEVNAWMGGYHDQWVKYRSESWLERLLKFIWRKND